MRFSDPRRCLLLQALPGLSSQQLCQLLQYCGGVDALWDSDPARWPPLALPPGLAGRFCRMRDSGRAADPRVDVDAQLMALEAAAARVLCVVDEAYPPLLRTIHDPPPVLYLRGDGDLLLRPQLAVVGARRASSAGLRAARDIAAALAGAGLVVTSGLALGIDGAAHRGALDAGGGSVAVMATGIEQIYPRRHAALARDLLAGGCLVTEFPPGCGPLREHFPRRNRVISGLALGVLVVEAALPSGSLITAGTALEQGREVFTLPWSIYHPAGRGCLQLLRDGAALVQGVEDLLQELQAMVGLQRALSLPAPAPVEQPRVECVDERLLRLIGDGCVAVDELARHSELPLARVVAALSALELAGRVRRQVGGYSRR